MLDDIAFAETGRRWGLAGQDLSDVLDPMSIVTTRSATGGAAPDAVNAMVDRCRTAVTELSERVAAHRSAIDQANESLLAQVRNIVNETEDSHGSAAT